MVSGLRPATFENLQLNAGVFLENFDYSGITNGAELKAAILTALTNGAGVLGATIGDGSFQCTPEIRQIEANGMRYPIKGSTVNDSWTVKLTGTMKEITSANFKRALMTADVAVSGKKSTIKIRTDIKAADYITKLCWVGDTSKGFVLISLDNALNLTGANFTFTDKGEGSLPFEFQAHAADLASMEYAPCEIVILDNPDLTSLTVSSAAGTSTGKTALTVSGYSLQTGDSYVYKTDASTAPTVVYDQDLTSWTAWNGSSELTITNGYKVTVAVVNASSKAVAAGSATVTSAA